MAKAELSESRLTARSFLEKAVTHRKAAEVARSLASKHKMKAEEARAAGESELYEWHMKCAEAGLQTAKDCDESVADVEQVVAQLDGDIYLIFKMYFIEGLTWEEVAEELGTSVQWVHRLRPRGFDQVAKLIA